jgi:DNA-binding NarL/FixJ family response regulator
MTKAIRIAIADDHPMVVDGLQGYFKLHPEIEIVSTTNRLNDVVKIVSNLKPDVLLMDYHFINEKQTGLDKCKELVLNHPYTKIIIISSFAEVSLVKRFVEAGASGYLLKTATKNEYVDAILNVFAGGESFGKEIRELLVKDKLGSGSHQNIQFTRIEKDILKLIIQGYSTNDIAKKLFREKSTIDSHRKSILAKFYQMDSENDKPSKNISHYLAKYKIEENLDRF